MKIADYGKAITSYIESPTTAQKLKSKESANLLAEIDFSGMTVPQLRILYERYTGSGAPRDPRELIIELKRLMKNLDQDGIPFATGGRVNLAEGSEDIVEPPKSMQVDTTTKGPDLFTLDKFKDKAEIYILALNNRAMPLEDIKSALNKFTKQGLNDGTFTVDEAIKVVQNLKFEVQDRAQKQRLRDNIIAGTGTLSREDFAIGGGVIEGEDLGSREGFADPNIEFPFLNSTGQTDYRIGRFKDTGKFFRRLGKKKQTIIIQEEGESLEDFRKREGPRTDLAFDKTVTTRKYIDNWTKNWLDNNLQKYGVKDFDVMLNDLSSAWQNEIETGNVPQAKKNFNLTTPNLNLPNITSAQDVRMKQKKGAKTDLTAFTYDDVRFYNNAESSKALRNKVLAQYRKIFYKNKIQTNPALRQDLKKFYDFMAMDKAGLPQGGGLTIRDFLKTEVTDDVKFLIDREASGLDKGAKKEVFHSFPDLKNNYDVFTASKAKLKAVQSIAEAKIKAGAKTSAQTDELINQIKNQNKIVADMKPEELVKDKRLIQSLRLVINPQTGQASFIGYTENDPRVIKKGVKTDLELAEHAIERAKKGSLFSYDHISKRSFGKMNTQFANNIQGANYITNTQIENARRFLEIPENRKTPAAQNLDKVLEDLGLTIRGKEYGGIKYGNKINIVFDSNTNRSNIVDQQLIKKDVIPTADQAPEPEATKTRKLFEGFGERIKSGASDLKSKMDSSKFLTSKIPGGAAVLGPVDFALAMLGGAPVADAAASAGSYLIKDPYLGKAVNIPLALREIASYNDVDEMLRRATERREGIESMLESIPSRFKETINEAKGVKDETEEFVP
jgi:hypothetical protein